MIRLIVIRVFESIYRNFYIIVAPALIVPLITLFFQVIQQPTYLSGATLQIRYNYEISKVIGYEKFESSHLDPSERTFAEISELMGTDAFVDKILANVDFTNENGRSKISSSQKAKREFLRENVELQISGIRQVGIIAYMPTPKSAQQVITAIYNEYLNHQIETIGGSGRNLVEFMNIYLEEKTAQKDRVQAELEAYLISHPEDPNFDRREIEVTQIAQLSIILEDLIDDIEFTKDILDLGNLVEGTSERYFQETFLLLDDPFEPISMTSLTKKLSNIIQGAVVGAVLSIGVFGILVIFDRRIMLPIDLNNATDLPLLTMVPKEHQQGNERFRWKYRNLDLSSRVRRRLKERLVHHANRVRQIPNRSRG